MISSKFRKLVFAVLCASLAFVLFVPFVAFAADGPDGADAGDGAPGGAESAGGGSTRALEKAVPADCLLQDVGSLAAEGKLTCTNPDVTMQVDEASGALVIEGGKSSVMAATFVIGKDFNFGSGTIGRFTFSGVAATGKKVVLGFYLDDQTEPFFTTQLAAQTGSSWESKNAVSKNILAKGITGTHKVSFKVLDCSTKPSFAVSSFEFGLASVPILNVNIDESLGTIEAMNQATHHDQNCYGSISIDVPAGCKSAMTGDSLSSTGSLDLEYIRGRGNSTWEANKKPYKFKLDKAASLLGMGSNKHWALMANAYDSSKIRNVMTARLGRELGIPFTPAMEPVEVIMNGRYLGSYLLAETVRVDTNRVEIDKDDGFLLSLGNWTLDKDKLNFTTEKKGGVLQVENPDLFATSDTTRLKYIQGYVQDVEDAIFAKDFDRVGQLMDLNSAAMYYWFEEFSMNGDAYTSGSCYLYKDKGGKLCWGPLWDFDLAWSGAVTEDLAQKNLFWNNKMFQNPAFVAELKATWSEFKPAVDELIAYQGTMDQLLERTSVSTAYDAELWHENGLEGTPVTPDEAYEAAVADIEDLRMFIAKRSKWIDINLDSQTSLTPASVSFVIDGKTIETRNMNVGEQLGLLPAIPEKEGFVNGQWKYDVTYTLDELLADSGMNEEQYRDMLMESKDLTLEEANAQIEQMRSGSVSTLVACSETFVFDGMVLHADYEDANSLAAVKAIHLPFDTVYTVAGSSDLEIPFELEPLNPDGNTVKFISNNPDVVQTDSGRTGATVVGPGDAEVTLKPTVGVSKTVKVHVYSPEEYMAAGSPSGDDASLADKSLTLTTDSYSMLQLGNIDEGAVMDKMPVFATSDANVAEVGPFGLVHAVSPGVTAITCVNGRGFASVCIITVKAPEGEGEGGEGEGSGSGSDSDTSSNSDSSASSGALKVGSQASVGKLKYQITSMKGARTVACIGPKNASVSASISVAKVPATVKIKSKSYRVTAIARNAFKGCKKLTKLTVGNRVQVIGAGAFRGCSKLKTVYLGKGIQIVEKSAFRSCKRLTKVNFASKHKPKVYSTAFKGCKKAKYFVPKSQKKYYKMILPKKRVK